MSEYTKGSGAKAEIGTQYINNLMIWDKNPKRRGGTR